MPIVERINNLRKRVESMIKNKENYSEIYEVNVRLDKLIDEYYKENKKNS